LIPIFWNDLKFFFSFLFSPFLLEEEEEEEERSNKENLNFKYLKMIFFHSSVFGATEFSKVTQLFCRLPLAALSCVTIDH